MFPKKGSQKDGIALAVVLCAFGVSCSAGVVLDVPGHVAVERTSITAKGGESGASWSLLDWRNRPTGIVGSFDDTGKAVLPQLSTGYYRLVGEANPTNEPRALATLAVVPDPKTRPKVSGSFYGADCATSQLAVPGQIDCPWNGGDRRLTVADLA